MCRKHRFFTHQSTVTVFSFTLMVWAFIFFSLEPISAETPQKQGISNIPQTNSDCPPDYNPGAYLYPDTAYGGACYHTLTDIADLGQTPLGDNNVSSIQLRGWYVVKLFEHPNWQGRSYEVIVDDDNLDEELLGGTFSSLRIRPQRDLDIIISNIWVASGKNYYLARCETGSEYYIDDDYVFTGFSKDSYDGLWCIKTANRDKNDDSRTFLTFELNKPATVYIYFDRRMRKPPGWVEDLFEQNTKKVFVSDYNMDYFVVYSCNSHPGTITLGGPKYGGGDRAKAMYLVAFREGVWSDKLCSGIEPAATPTYTPTPKSTPAPTATPTPAINPDVAGDGQVDIFDLSFVASRYNSTDPAADVNSDGLVDIFDLTIIASNYGR